MDIANLPGVAPARRAEQPEKRRDLPKPATGPQFLRFCAVGLSNAVVDLGALNLLLLLYPTQSDLTLLLYNTIAVMLAILNSYLWNTRWTFREQATSSGRERTLFVAQALLNIAINNIVLFAMTDLLPTSTGDWSILSANLAKLAAMVAASSISFVLLRAVVFRAKAP
jgi:putative flippase GtrA